MIEDRDATAAMTPGEAGRETGNGCRPAPDAVWAEVREAYLGGLSAPECCRRYGVGLTALRDRAAREGWRRADQPWTPPHRLDPWDEGVELEAAVGGDLDRVDYPDLSWVAQRRMMRAVMRGDAAEALRWRRVREMLDDEEARLQWLLARDDAWRFQHGDPAAGDDPDGPDASDASDGVFAVRPDRPIASPDSGSPGSGGPDADPLESDAGARILPS